MKKRLIAHLTLTSLLVTLSPAGLLAAQGGGAPKRGPNPLAPGQAGRLLPRHAVVGSTAERRAAWERLTPEQRQEYLQRFQAYLKDPLKAAADKQHGPNKPKPRDRWVRSDLLGKKIRSAVPDAITQSGAVSLTDRSGALATSQLMRPIDEDPGTYPPQVSVSASPLSGAAPLTVQFNSYAYDPDGYVTDYSWDFGDGSSDFNANPTHTYTAPGVYTAWLTVFDDSGLSAWASVNITVTGGGENLPPTVTAGGSPLSGFAPLTVGFNAAASDPDGWIASYSWTFGDGQSSSQASPSHVYQSPGSFTATVTVTDNSGATASASLGVQVAAVSGSGDDADGDGLPDGFEGTLADAFTPIYRVSAGEQPGTGFARFGDYTPQTVIQNLPAVPPITHFRVTPVGFATDAYGRQLGFLQVDYLTIWNRDDGLDVGWTCRTYASILGGLIGFGLTELIDGLGSHPLDDERSAVLVAAPTNGSFQYPTDPAAYQAYDYYTAAHEYTFFDHSAYFGPTQPVPAYYHLNLSLSKAKHSTYPFNPDYSPLFPDWVIYTTYSTIDFLYWEGYIYDYWDYQIYLYMADTAFYNCFVEHFQDQGGWFPGLQLNVGELSHPINGSGFILDPRVSSKFSPLLWQVQ
jgi:PKD repeat protein